MTSEWHLGDDSFARPKLYDYDALKEAVARAKTCRWLTVHEIITILSAGPTIIMPLTFEPPKDPPRSGSLFLYDRSITKDYKQDGHSWIRKQKNNKVREDHVKLRYDGNFRVSGAYVHDANNTTLHRRSYHLIENGLNVRKQQDEGKQSLVLVHYLDTVEATNKLALFARHEKSSAQQGVMKDDNISTTVSHIILSQPKQIFLVNEGQLNQSKRVAKPQDDRSCQSQHGASLGLISSQLYQLPLACDHTNFRGISKETRINKLNTTNLSDESFFKTETSDKLVVRGSYPTNTFVNTMGIQHDYQSTIQHPLPSIDKLRGDNYEQIIPSFPSNINLCLGRSSNTLPEIIDITPSEADICSSTSVVISVSNPGGLLLYQDKRQWQIYAVFAMISDDTRQHSKSITVWLAPAYVLTPFSVKCEKVPEAIEFVCKLKIILVRIPAEAISKGISKEVFATKAEHAVKDFLQYVEEKNAANVEILGPVYRSSIGTVDIITQMSKKEFHFFENPFLPKITSNVKNRSPECSADEDFGEATAPLSPGDRIIESARGDCQDINISQSFQDDEKRNLMNQKEQVLEISDTTKYKMNFDQLTEVMMGGRKRKVIHQEIEGQIAKSKRAAAASASFALSTVHPFGSDEDENYS